VQIFQGNHPFLAIVEYVRRERLHCKNNESGTRSNEVAVKRLIQPMALMVFLALSCSQCAYVFKNIEPIPSVYHTLSEEKKPATLIVLLPGIFSGPDYYVSKGIVGDVRKNRVQADMVAVDAHSGYYRDKSLFPRLLNDIIQPARHSGYTNIWLVGVSLGGLGALLFAQAHPEAIDGIISLAPYLGNKKLYQEIQQTQGFRFWKPSGPIGPEDRYRSVLLWLQQHSTSGNPKPAIYIGYGRDDRFAPLLDLVTEVLPPEHVLTVPGGHFWTTWRTILVHFMNQGIFETENDPSPDLRTSYLNEAN